ncbi:MAG: helix-turn-helix domain-containing protein [Nitrososphaerota archaeon]
MPSKPRAPPLSQALHQASLDALRYIKRQHNYRRLAATLGISTSTLSRYLSGKTIPRTQKIRAILEGIVDNIKYDELVAEFYGQDLDLENGVYICHDIDTIKLLASYLLRRFMGSKVDSVLAVEEHAIPLATYFAALIHAELYFTQDKHLWRDSLEIVYRSEGGHVKNNLWLPRGVARRGKSVLVITTALLNHSPYKEIFNVLQDKRAYVAGLFALVSKRNIWTTLSVPPGCTKIVVKMYE